MAEKIEEMMGTGRIVDYATTGTILLIKPHTSSDWQSFFVEVDEEHLVLTYTLQEKVKRLALWRLEVSWKPQSGIVRLIYSNPSKLSSKLFLLRHPTSIRLFRLFLDNCISIARVKHSLLTNEQENKTPQQNLENPEHNPTNTLDISLEEICKKRKRMKKYKNKSETNTTTTSNDSPNLFLGSRGRSRDPASPQPLRVPISKKGRIKSLSPSSSQGLIVPKPRRERSQSPPASTQSMFIFSRRRGEIENQETDRSSWPGSKSAPSLNLPQ
eukprot:CAMPEP_0174251580 /NCGR_PEP_ID=MMETSP0439-20130205/1351_1 /TAXON_ID=0 /ORGANISM="Stereomyxa ramosa, Strain Chinc5" /LENGTH=269 /DNA_ID=CAMNT_0015331921 /DNA_START=60 /DNA_END=869 /DNA_ORIENTATION=-